MPRGASYGRSVYALAAVPPVVGIAVAAFAPKPHGHWTEHLSGATLKGTMLVLLLVLVTMLGWRTLSVVLLLAFAVMGAGIVLQVTGDVQVADSIWRTAGDPETGTGYERGHDNSAFGDLVVSVGGLAFVIAAGIARRVSLKVAIAGALLMIFPPPFFWPAVGVLVLLMYGLTSEAGFRRRPGAIMPDPPARAQA